jgi:hypothetical protein
MKRVFWLAFLVALATLPLLAQQPAPAATPAGEPIPAPTPAFAAPWPPPPAVQPTPAPSPAAAVAPAAAGAAAGPAQPPLALTLGGFYEFNGYSQNNFFLGRDAAGGVTDRDAYMIHLFRIQPELSYGPNLKGVMRIDLAQSIWGIDNEQRDNDRPGFSNLFNNKDTAFLVHLDWAYVEFNAQKLGNTLFRVGRMKNQLGNMLVLDQSADGIQAVRKFGTWNTTLAWTKMFEGADSLTDDRYPTIDGRDADLFYVSTARKFGAYDINPFFAQYRDGGWRDGRSYLPNEVQYFNARFRPNITSASVLGLAFSGKTGRVTLKGEVDILSGEDKINNLNSGPNQLLDVNNGDLEGYNLYVDGKMPFRKATLGFVLGQGSGDSDVTSGKGNINKIRTNGFWYVTEVWEDSIMPDEEGITPQGLGSPGSRGYRELENTTLAQVNFSYPLRSDLRLFLSASGMRATKPLRPWRDVNGNGVIEPSEFGTTRSRDLGTEFDFMVDYTVMPNLIWTLRGGYMWAGDATGYLINGTNAFDSDPWEIRTTLRFNYSGLKIGG